MELPENDLAASASLPVQQQFYQEAGIKMAAFMGCEGGEIEVGMSPAAANGEQMNLQASLEQVFSEEFFQQSLLEELLQLQPTRPSSSSSSLPSVSAGSQADCSTSLLCTTAMSSATPSPRDLTVASLLHPSPPHPVPFGRHGHSHFPSAEADDAAMAQAMLAVISASSSSALPTPSTPPPGNHRAQRWPRRGSTTAFRSYNAALAPRAPSRPPGAPGQRMIKMGISILRRMHIIRCNRERTAGAAEQRGQEEEAAAAPSSSQLHHMISERRRRERLNESFEALRGLLPPGSKKDKATVLAKTLEYMNLLTAQISDLEAKNRSLEGQIHRQINGSPTSRTANEAQWLTSGSTEKVQVQVSSGAGASSVSRREVTIRVAARAECDLSELVLRVIALLKEMGRFAVVSMDARQPSSNSGIAQANLTLRATAGGFDEASLKEAVAKAVEGLVTPPPDEP